MKGLIAYLVSAASVCALIPWPEYWPIAFAGIAFSAILVYAPAPRTSGGKLARGRGS